MFEAKARFVLTKSQPMRQVFGAEAFTSTLTRLRFFWTAESRDIIQEIVTRRHSNFLRTDFIL
jgi:hypothetical protein